MFPVIAEDFADVICHSQHSGDQVFGLNVVEWLSMQVGDQCRASGMVILTTTLPT